MPIGPSLHPVTRHADVFLPRGDDIGVSTDGAEFADPNAAWKEMTGVCGDMIADIARKLPENAEWQMELLDEAKKPVFRIRLVSETLDGMPKKPRVI